MSKKPTPEEEIQTKETEKLKQSQEKTQREKEEQERRSLARQSMIWLRDGFDNGTAKVEEFYSKAANSKVVTKNYAKYDKFMRNPVVKILTSNTVGRVMAIGCIASAALGITAGGWPVAGVGIAAVAIGMAIDTAIVDRTRNLYKEAKFLHRHREASDKQELILKQNPYIEAALSDTLYKPKQEGKSKDKRLTRDISTGRRYAENYTKGLVIAAIDFAASIVGVVFSHSPIRAIKTAGEIAGGGIGAGSENYTLSQKRESFRKYIDSERDKTDTPVYDNLLDLKKAAREQKIQTMALKELLKDPEIMSPMRNSEMIQKKFDTFKKEIESKEKAIIYGNNALYRTSQVVKNFFHAHNPLSEYSEPDKVGAKLFNKIEHHKKWAESMPQLDKKKVRAQTIEQVRGVASKMTDSSAKPGNSSQTGKPRDTSPKR